MLKVSEMRKGTVVSPLHGEILYSFNGRNLGECDDYYLKMVVPNEYSVVKTRVSGETCERVYSVIYDNYYPVFSRVFTNTGAAFGIFSSIEMSICGHYYGVDIVNTELRVFLDIIEKYGIDTDLEDLKMFRRIIWILEGFSCPNYVLQNDSISFYLSKMRDFYYELVNELDNHLNSQSYLNDLFSQIETVRHYDSLDFYSKTYVRLAHQTKSCTFLPFEGERKVREYCESIQIQKEDIGDRIIVGQNSNNATSFVIESIELIYALFFSNLTDFHFFVSNEYEYDYPVGKKESDIKIDYMMNRYDPFIHLHEEHFIKSCIKLIKRYVMPFLTLEVRGSTTDNFLFIDVIGNRGVVTGFYFDLFSLLHIGPAFCQNSSDFLMSSDY